MDPCSLNPYSSKHIVQGRTVQVYVPKGTTFFFFSTSKTTNSFKNEQYLLLEIKVDFVLKTYHLAQLQWWLGAIGSDGKENFFM